MTLHDLETLRRTLVAAEDEICNPGTARANDYDILGLIDQACGLVELKIKCIALHETEDRR